MLTPVCILQRNYRSPSKPSSRLAFSVTNSRVVPMNARFLLASLLLGNTFLSQAATLNVTHMSFAGGTFAISGYLPTPIAMAGSDKNLVGGYSAFPYQLYPFCCAMSFYTSDGRTAAFGGAPIGGGPAPSATVDTVADTLRINLSSWTANWNGTNFEQGAADVTGMWDRLSGAYEIDWSAPIIGGPFDGAYGLYTLYGVASVPEVETSALMLSGLALVGIATRRRRGNPATHFSPLY